MNIELSKRLHDRMISHQFVVSIMGHLNQEFLKSIIKITDVKLSKLDLATTMKNRIFHFMVECTQNLCRSENEEKFVNNSLFLIGKSDNDYSVFLGSIFSKSDAGIMADLIEKVNNFDTQDVKDKFYDEISIKEDSKKNQMLLSLLSISKRTKEKINYDHFQIDESNIFLSFKIVISNNS
jgi:hypothetical protein